MTDAYIEERKVDDAPADAAPAPADGGIITDDTPAEPSGPASAPDDVDPLDALLAEYDQSVAKAAPAPAPDPAELLDQHLARELEQHQAAERQRYGESIAEASRYKGEAEQALAAAERATNTLQQVQAFLQRENDQRDFDRIAAGIQSRLPSHLPDDYASLKLMDVARADPAVAIAFDNRHKSVVALSVERDQVRNILAQALLTRPDLVPQLQERAQYLSIAMQSKEIMARVRGHVIEEARKVKPPLDENATLDHAAVIASLRGAGAKHTAEPPPNLGQLSEADFRRHTRENYGF